MPAPVLHAPPSKSLTHRALLLAALADRPCVVVNPGLGADNLSTLDALRGWGADATIDRTGEVPRIVFRPFEPQAPTAPLPCGNSGTTLRFLAGQAARFGFSSVLCGDASLNARPSGPLLEALASLGAQVESRDGRAPLTISGPLRSGPVALRGGLSSQFASSLIFALAMTDGPSTLRLLPPVASRPYLDLTLGVAERFGLGLTVEEEGDGLRVTLPGGRRPRAERYTVEGDWSGAAFPLAAAALTGRPVELRGLRADSGQGDRAIVDFLRLTGAVLDEDDDAVRVSGRAVRGFGDLDVGDTPDLFPMLAAAAAALPGTTRLRGSPGLRHKECDRIAAMAEGLRRMGARVDELPDGAVIHGAPGALRGAAVRTFHDHRIHMALAVVATLAEGPSDIAHPECVAVSYPTFHEHLSRIAGAA